MEGVQFLFLGGYGSDAGGWYIGADGKIHHFEGWGVEALSDVRLAVAILDLASKFNNPRMTDVVSQPVTEFVQNELGGFVGGLPTVAIG